MKPKQFEDRLNRLFHKAINKNRNCCYPNCENTAINSHILQKNGILSSIANDRHIYVSKTNFFNSELFFFTKSGLNVTFTFKGFCKEHDKSIFQPIEDFEIDFDNYGNQLLFAYRTLLNEKRKKEVLIDWYHLQINDELLGKEINKSIARESIVQDKLAIKDLEYYESKMLSDLNLKTENFNFKVRYTKETDICLASHFTFETTRQRKNKIDKTGTDYELLTDIFISFFPLENENVLIMGYLKEMENICGEFVNSFIELDEDKLFKQLSNLLLRRCEEWACSETFYLEKIRPREEKIYEIFREAAVSIDEDENIDFNIFN